MTTLIRYLLGSLLTTTLPTHTLLASMNQVGIHTVLIKHPALEFCWKSRLPDIVIRNSQAITTTIHTHLSMKMLLFRHFGTILWQGLNSTHPHGKPGISCHQSSTSTRLNLQQRAQPSTSYARLTALIPQPWLVLGLFQGQRTLAQLWSLHF